MKELRTYGKVVTVEVEILSENKFEAVLANNKEVLENARRVRYTIENFEIVTGDDAKAIEAESDGSCIDDNHEYLVLHLVDGDTATFRNSYVDMFRV